jgi:IPT/TIG domain
MIHQHVLAAVALATVVSAQAATSNQHVELQAEMSNGRKTQSTTYVLDGSFGVGVTGRRTTSRLYVMEGGFSSTLNVTAGGRPWLTAVEPRHVAMRGRATLTLRGTQLDVGSPPTVRIGGVATPVLSRSREAITTTLPIQPEPGWLPVTIDNSHGTTILPRGVAVLPLIEADPAPASEREFDLLFRGTKGDRIIWAMGISQSPPLFVTGVHFGFALGPPPFEIFAGFGITGNDGILRLPVGGRKYPVGFIFVQALFLSSHPGYAPGSFSNVLRL